MKIENTRFGTIEVPDETLITFPQGIIGFHELRRFVILDHDDRSFIRWLQAVDRPELAFVIIDPLPLVKDYPVERILAECDDLGLGPDEEVAIAAVMTLLPAPKPPTVNLLAPVVMGVTARRGKQVVLHDSPYHTQHPIVFSQPEKAAGAQTASK